jgi:predicted PurR-regulated permease PerM
MQNIFKLKSLVYTFILLFSFTLLVIFLGRVLLPFLIALILSYIINPFICYLEKNTKLSRTIISFFVAVLIFLLFITIPIIIIPNIIIQIKSLIYYLPNILDMINKKILYNINMHYGTNIVIKIDNIRMYLLNNIVNISKHLTMVSPIASNSLIFLELFIYILLVPFIMFYALKNWNLMLKFIDEFIPKRYYKNAHNIISDIDSMLASYLRGQLSVMIVMSIYYMVALNIVGVKFATIIGFVTGALVFVPYIGVLLGLFMSLIIGFISFSSNNVFIGIAISFLLGHLLEGAIITPQLVGSRIGLNPIMIIFALMFFGKLFGFIGILLALPLTAISVVLLKHLKIYYLKSEYYNEEY